MNNELEWADAHPWKAHFNAWVMILVACFLPGGRRVSGPLCKMIWTTIRRLGRRAK